MSFDIAFNPPQFYEEYDGVKMRQLVEELERLHAVLTSDTDDEGVAADVTSFNTRTGDVLPLQADYDSFFLTPAEGDAAYAPLGSGVLTFEGRAGNVTATVGDYADVAETYTVLQTFSANLIANHGIFGDPGTEGTGITVNGATYESSAKVSDLGGTNAAQFILHRHSTTLPALIIGARSKTDDDTHAVVADSDILMTLLAAGWDGVDSYSLSSEMRFEVDGTPGANAMPGQITFMTAPTGTEVPIERMRIRADGKVEIVDPGGTDYVSMYHDGTDFYFGTTNTDFIRSHGQDWIFRDGLTYFQNTAGSTKVAIRPNLDYLGLNNGMGLRAYDGGVFRLYAAGNSVLSTWAMDAVAGLSLTVSTGGLEIAGTLPLWIRDGAGLKISDGLDTSYVTMSHDVDDLNIVGTGAVDINITGYTNLNIGGTAVSLTGHTHDTGDITDIDFTGAADNDLMYRSGGNWIDTAGLLTWDGSILQVQSVGGTIVDLRDNNSTGAAASASMIFTDQVGTTLGAVGVLPTIDTLTLAGSGNLLIDANSGAGVVQLSGAHVRAEGTIFTKQVAAAEADIAGYGQIWSKTDDTLWWTNAAGTDVELGVGGGGNDTPHDIIGDINLTSGTVGPIAGAFTAELRFLDNDETDTAGVIGFQAADSGDLIIQNLTENSDIIFKVFDLNGAGSPIRLMRLHKGNSASPGEEGYAMFNRVICNYLGSSGSSPDDPPLMVTNSGGDEDGQTASNLSIWYNVIQAYTASAAAGSTLSINPSGGIVNLGNNSGAGTASNVVMAHGTLWLAQTKTAGLNLSWRTSTLPSGGAVPNDAYYSIATHAQSHVASFGARASDNSMVLTHDIHGAPWIIEGQNEAGTARKIAQFETTQAISGVYVGEVNQQSSLWLWEEAAALADQAGWGQIWVKSDIPNTLWFTDDAGNDFQLSGGGGIGGSITDNQIAVGATTADDIEGSANLTWDGSILQVQSVGGTIVDLRDNNSTGSAAAVSMIFTDQVGTTLGAVGVLPTVNTLSFAGSGNLLIDANSGAGVVQLSGAEIWSENAIFIAEIASAAADNAAYGQIWVKSNTPNEPWFTPDDGNDVRIDPSVSEVNGKTASYQLLYSDRGKTIRFTGATASKVLTIPANASVAFPIGTLIAVHNDGSVAMTVAITTDTLTWAKDNTTGTRTLAAGASAVIQKVASTSWKIAGSALVT